jgi:Ca2+-binding RTX toxin-like protein
MPRSPLLLTFLAGLAAAVVAAAPAHATTAALSPDGRFLDIGESAPGEVNHLVGKLVAFEGRQYVDLYDDAPITAGAGCYTSSETSKTRCVDPSQQVRVALGGGRDRFTVSEVGTDITFGAGSLLVDLGSDADEFEGRGTNAVVEVRGGEGDDDLRGSLNTDHLDGGPGDDKVHGYEGADDLHGGAGNDTLTGDGPSNSGVFADVLDGGEGRDRLDDYVYSGDPMNAPAISIALDGQANDGRQGEGDNVTAIEAVKTASAGSFSGDEAPNEFVAPQTGPAGTLAGNGGDDTLIAGDADGDVVDGGAGADLVEGGFGDDRLVGGPGRDTVNGDRKTRCNEYSCDLIVAGNDTIEVRDGDVDSVSCGPGADRVVADAADAVAADCETVDRGGAASSGPGAGAGSGRGPGAGQGGAQAKPALKLVAIRLGTALRRGFRVRVSGVQGTVKLTARRGRTVVARGSARAARNGTAVVTLRFTRAGKRSLRGARKVALRLTGATLSKTVTLRR